MKFIAILILCSLLQCENLANTLSLSYSIENDKILCTGKLNEEVIQTEVDVEATLKLVEETYGIVENKHHKKKIDFAKGINELSKSLLNPFGNMVEECNQIVVTIDSNLVKIPFEYLNINETELAISKPLIFRLKETNITKIDSILVINSGLIVRNKSCDPQNACKMIKQSNPELKFYSSKSIEPDQLSNVDEDLLLVSAHGNAFEKNRGFTGWNKTPIEPKLLEKLNPKITYFDSCQQGINLNYIESLLKSKGLNYYIAPIISNDSGDSSTKTIKWFFEKINTGHPPIIALFETKKRLNSHYKRKKLLTRYNKSLSFRLYIL